MRKRSRAQSFFRGHVLKEYYVILDMRLENARRTKGSCGGVPRIWSMPWFNQIRKCGHHELLCLCVYVLTTQANSGVGWGVIFSF